MKKLYSILGIVFALITMTLWASADDYIDDVYYWQGDEPIQRQGYTQPAKQPREERIVFIEDSITQRSDTVVKAIIRR